MGKMLIDKHDKTEKQEATKVLGSSQSSMALISIIAFSVALITFLVYLPALQNGFVNWDDNLYVYENQNIQSISLRLFSWMPEVTIWHPLTMFSLAIDYAIWGLNPLGYHLTNNILHAFNTFLVLILVVQLMRNGIVAGQDNMTNKKILIAGFVTALLFGVHPVHVESVAWISERKDVLCAFFFLLTLITYIKYAASDTKMKRGGYYALSLFLFILALMSKPMAVSLPAILLILDYYPLKRLKSGEPGNAKWMLIEKLPFFLLSIIATLLTIWAHHEVGGLKTLERYPFDVRLFVAVWAYIFYLIKLVFPVNLAPFYPHPGEINFFTFRYIGSFIFLLILTSFAIRSFKKDRFFSAIWVYYVVVLVPAIGIVQVGGYSVADRFTYLPSLGLFLLAGLGIGSIFGRCSKKQYLTLFAIVFVVLGILTIKTNHQISIWRNSFTLWSHEIRLFPDALIAYENRGSAYYESGRYPQAIEDFNTAININPQYGETYNNRGNVYMELGDYWQAIMDYNRAIELDTYNTKAYNNRGSAYYKLGRYHEAIENFDIALKSNPRYAEAYNNRGNAYIGLGDYRQAIEDYNRAIELNPKNAKAYNNRGGVYIYLDSYQQAIEDYSRAIELNPRYGNAYYNRGIANKNLGDSQKATEDFNMADQLNPDDGRRTYSN